jgi:uncharacterized protein YdeI (YjbR/CyaY-like superfamily)
MFFEKPADLRKWLTKNHKTAKELWVGMYKTRSGKPSITWPQVVDEALCFGWIDGIRKGIDEHSYMNRITPRRPNSIWSAVNIKRVGELDGLGRLRPAGRAAFEGRNLARAGLYSSEQRKVELPPALAARFKKSKAAWAHFNVQPAGYRKTITWWVVSAKREETQLKRLARVIEVSSRGKRVDLLKPFELEG